MHAPIYLSNGLIGANAMMSCMVTGLCPQSWFDTQMVACRCYHGLVPAAHMPDKHFTLHAMLQAAATRAEQVLADFTPQAVANLMWAFAALSHKPGVLLQYTQFMQYMQCLSQLAIPLQLAAC